jgi:hypothetical protein
MSYRLPPRMKKPNDACDESEAEAILGPTLKGVNGGIMPFRST